VLSSCHNIQCDNCMASHTLCCVAQIRSITTTQNVERNNNNNNPMSTNKEYSHAIMKATFTRATVQHLRVLLVSDSGFKRVASSYQIRDFHQIRDVSQCFSVHSLTTWMLCNSIGDLQFRRWGIADDRTVRSCSGLWYIHR
jgi:hypothetical protein